MSNTSLYKQQALIFVHGFNVSFEEALLRTGQIAFDLEFDGGLITFSWPTKGIAVYGSDLDRADGSAQYLANLILTLSETHPDVTLHLVAHSMGNRVLSAALKILSMSEPQSQKLRIGQIIMAHADVSVETCRQIGKMKKLAKGKTLYVNTDDRALAASSALRMGRARCGSTANYYPGIDTIDTTGMGGRANFFSLIQGQKHHSVFVRDPLLFGELTRLLMTGQQPPSARTPEFKKVVNKRGEIYWKYDLASDITAETKQ